MRCIGDTNKDHITATALDAFTREARGALIDARLGTHGVSQMVEAKLGRTVFIGATWLHVAALARDAIPFFLSDIRREGVHGNRNGLL